MSKWTRITSRERFIPFRDGVEQIAHWHDVAQLERVLLLDQQLEHDLQRRPFTLQHRRNVHQGFHESRAERVNLAESGRIGIARQQHIHHFLLDLLRLPEGIIHLLPGGFGLGFEDSPLGDGWQVPVFQFDGGEPSFPMLERVAETDDACPGQVFTRPTPANPAGAPRS